MMKLLTKELRSMLPPIGSRDGHAPEDVRVPVKFFTPDSNWTWYAYEADDDSGDTIFFGLVCGFEKEYGTFSLNEMKGARGPLGLSVERDLYWDRQTTLHDVQVKEGL